MVTCVLLASALAAAPADPPPKKDDRQTVTLRRWVPEQKIFLDPREVKMSFVERKGRTIWVVRPADLKTDAPRPGSEVVSADAAGNKTAWVVERVHQTAAGDVNLFCRRKDDPPPKKCGG